MKGKQYTGTLDLASLADSLLSNLQFATQSGTQMKHVNGGDISESHSKTVEDTRCGSTQRRARLSFTVCSVTGSWVKVLQLVAMIAASTFPLGGLVVDLCGVA